MCISVIPGLLEETLHMSGDNNGHLSGLSAMSKTVTCLSIGYISDKLGMRRVPLLVTSTGYFVMAYFFWRSGAFWHLMVGRIAQGISSGTTWTVVPGMVADVFTGKQLGARLAIAYTGSQLAHIIGPFFGGVALDKFGKEGVAAFIALLALADVLFRIFILPDSLRLKYELGLSEDPDELDGGNQAADPMRPREWAEAGARPAALATTLPSSPPLSPSVPSGGGHGPRSSRRSSWIGVQSPIDLPPELLAMQVTAADAGSLPLQALQGSAAHQHHHHPLAHDDIEMVELGEGPAALQRRPPVAADSAEVAAAEEGGASMTGGQEMSSQLGVWQLMCIWPIQAYNFGTVSIVLIGTLLEIALPLELSKRYGLTATGIGAVFIALGVPSMLCATPVGWMVNHPKVLAYLRPFDRWGVVSLSILLNIICLFLLGLTDTSLQVVIVLVLISALHPLVTVPVMTGLANYLAEINCSSFAQVYALNQVSHSLVAILFPPIISWLYHKFSFASTTGIAATVLFALAFIVCAHPLYLIFKHGRAVFQREKLPTTE
ncbi:hypothetical protein EV182_004351 [Spiromyces aspiralis]|uniref:Uncharacterized protein n=1 Tax=Spiromyces aspiralis TaxID=68401 RepID=A0ACC1HFL9_9FUNG|nr:hypothetical protein EV182_004351 [Spiromyces aspiralis]